MAKADAWHAPGWGIFARGWSRRRSRTGLAGNAKIIAAPSYERLVAVEPLLRRSIPVLIIIFLVVIAAARFLSLMTVREDIEQNARTVLALAASELAGSISLSTPANGLDAETASLAVEKTIRRG